MQLILKNIFSFHNYILKPVAKNQNIWHKFVLYNLNNILGSIDNVDIVSPMRNHLFYIHAGLKFVTVNPLDVNKKM